MSEHEAVLFANESFYQAFADGDMDAMDALWSSRSTVSCIHPGWNPLLERDAAMESWRAILSGAGAPKIRCRNAVAHIYGDSAVVVCFEQIDDGFLVASNAFVREDRSWRMVHHQAGPAAAAPSVESDDDPSPLMN